MALRLYGDGSISGINAPASGLASSSVISSKILKVVEGSSTGQVNTSSTSAVSLNQSVSITVSNNSKVLIFSVAYAYGAATSGSWAGSSRVHLYMNGSEIIMGDHLGTISNEQQVFTHSLNYLTGALSAGTYIFSLYGSSVTGGTINFNRNNGTIIAMEIAS